MADRKKKHSGKTHLTKEGWNRLHTAAFSKKVARFSTYPDGENGSIKIVEHVDPRCYPIVTPVSWPEQYKREREQRAAAKKAREEAVKNILPKKTDTQVGHDAAA